jgi:hypothetical protein
MRRKSERGEAEERRRDTFRDNASTTECADSPHQPPNGRRTSTTERGMRQSFLVQTTTGDGHNISVMRVHLPLRYQILTKVYEHSEQARAPHTNGPRDVPRRGALSSLQKPLKDRGGVRRIGAKPSLPLPQLLPEASFTVKIRAQFLNSQRRSQCEPSPASAQETVDARTKQER